MAKKHDHGFEMMAVVVIVAVVGLIMMFMNSGSGSSSDSNLAGEAFRDVYSQKQQSDNNPENWVLQCCNVFGSFLCDGGDGNLPQNCCGNNRVCARAEWREGNSDN